MVPKMSSSSGLNFHAVLAGKLGILLVAVRLLLLLNAGDDAPSGTAACNSLCVGDGKEIALLN